MKPVIAIDGRAGSIRQPAWTGAGPRYVDTGAMYGVVGVLARRQAASTSTTPRRWQRCAPDRAAGRESAPTGRTSSPTGGDLSAGDSDGGWAGDLASRVSTRPVVRDRLVALQRRARRRGRRGDGRAGHRHGRLPRRAVKLYLAAEPACGRRRAGELAARVRRVVDVALAPGARGAGSPRSAGARRIAAPSGRRRLSLMTPRRSPRPSSRPVDRCVHGGVRAWTRRTV